MAFGARGAVIAPVRPDVSHQVGVAHSVFHGREQNYWGLAFRIRAFEKHDVDG